MVAIRDEQWQRRHQGDSFRENCFVMHGPHPVPDAVVVSHVDARLVLVDRLLQHAHDPALRVGIQGEDRAKVAPAGLE